MTTATKNQKAVREIKALRTSSAAKKVAKNNFCGRCCRCCRCCRF